MPVLKDITNQRFGRLIVVEIAEKIGRRTAWLCKCDCGNFTKVVSHSLLSRNTESCGCLYSAAKTTHGYTCGKHKHPLYSVWKGIKQRCYNAKKKEYKNYGGRGITVCDKWLNNPKEFIEWGLSHGYKKGLQIDREDNDGNYEPDNCHFTTQAENKRNQRLLRSTNTSGYRGAHKSRGKWIADVQHGIKTKYIGSFKTALEAAHARDKYVVDNNLNLPMNFP